jgi:hypothetical protein
MDVNDCAFPSAGKKKNQSNERQELIDFARAFYAISPASANFLN